MSDTPPVDSLLLSLRCCYDFAQVEEISAEISHKKAAKKVDPLEDFCDDNPEADECRVYED